MIKRRAIITDLHACIDELQELYNKLCYESIDEIWHTGDLVDRGPDSGAVVSFMREHGIKGVVGNHDDVIRQWHGKTSLPKNPDKARTIRSITREDDWAYLKELPPLHVFEDISTILVHGGLYPKLALYQQPPQSIIRLQLIHPDKPGETRWFVKDRKGIHEDEHRRNGWVRWYEVYDDSYSVVFGHSVFSSVLMHSNSQGGTCYGIDTGGVFGGSHTALILPGPKIIQVSGKQYAVRGNEE